MASRITQSVKSAPLTVGTGGNARITQSDKVFVADVTPVTLGGDARITQSVRVVIATIQLGDPGGLMLRGMGS